jgi:hypothetical protein
MTKHGNKPSASQSTTGIKAYLKLHRHEFLFFVSLLLLLSLIIREQVRDTAKERVDKLVAARNMFYLRMDALRFADEIMENIEPVKDASLYTGLTKDQLQAQLKEQLKIDFRANMASNHMGDTLSNLARSLDLSEQERNAVDTIYKQNGERAHMFETIGKTLEKQTATEQDLRAAKKIASDASALDYKILDLGTTLADRADSEIDRQEEIYKWASGLSYVLGLCLWYLAFLGKRYDVDLPEAEA